MKSKKTLPFVLAAFVLYFQTAAAVHLGPDPPDNIALTPDVRSIALEWDRVVDADYYLVYWGITEDADQGPIEVRNQTDYVKENLDPDTQYYFSVSSVDSQGLEGESSDSIRSRTRPLPPVPPDNFWITAVSDITETSVRLRWDPPAEGTVDVYRIRYGVSSGEYEFRKEAGASAEIALIEGLNANSRYFFNIQSVSKSNDDVSDESEPAGEIIVDTLPDENLPPDVPREISALLTGDREVTVSVDPGNENMVDYAGVIIRYGQTPGELNRSVDAGRDATHVFEDFPLNTTWFFSAVAYDRERGSGRNKSNPTEEISVQVEGMATHTDHFDDFGSGCFIGSLTGREKNREPAYDVTADSNKIGISGGYYLPAESAFDDFYGSSNYPVFLFYEKGLSRHLSIDFKAGYMRSSGKLRTDPSGAPTNVDATFTMIPTSASVNFRFPVFPHVWAFAGIGPDYWYIRETSDLDTRDDTGKWVGGYHGRAGLWLYNTDVAYRHWGMLIETRYSVVDRFGKNDFDPGGWLFLIGGFYSF